MPYAASIHLGLNALDAAHYSGYPLLSACENDARDMAAIARMNRFEPRLLLGRQAMSALLLRTLGEQASRMASGDRLMLTFAGHGSQLPDASADEPDRIDEAWCCFDRIVRDDELFNAISRFRPGVRVIVVADSCYSGSSIRRTAQPRELHLEPAGVSESTRYLPEEVAAAAYQLHRNKYDLVRSQTPRTAHLRCNAMLLSACRDNQVARDGERNGLFTSTLKRIWANGRFNGSYTSLVARIREQMPSYQIPGLLSLGPQAAQVEMEQPFR
jgi:hypothetical protein